jgi:hypothetical protein
MKAGALSIVTATIVAACTLAAAGGGSARATAPQWQSVPGLGASGIQFAFWAAGRLWIGNWGASGAGRLVSGRIVNGRVTGWVTTTVSLGSFLASTYTVLGEHLVYADTGSGGPPDVKAVRLLPNGKVSALSDLGGAPAPQSSTGTRVAQLPDRVIVQATLSVGGEKQHPAGCCDANGELVDWNSFLPYGAYASFGVDRHARLWLAWYARTGAKIVELDTATLKPRGKPVTAPGPTYKIDEMVCTDRCRLVIEGNWRDRRPTANHFWSWAPGERSVTQIKLPSATLPNTVPQLRGARDYRGHLVVAFEAPSKTGGTEIVLTRGDLRGGNMRVVRSLLIPFTLGPLRNPTYFYLANWGPGSGWGVGAAFGPNAFAAAAEYQGGNAGAVRVAILGL